MDDDAPTVRQVYALAAVLCARDGEAFPETRADASDLIERLRRDVGHPAPARHDTPLRPGRGRGRRRQKRRRDGDDLHDLLVDELLGLPARMPP